MGFTRGGAVAFVCAASFIWGRQQEIEVVTLLGLQSLIWTAGVIPVAMDGHRAFKTGVHTDVVAYFLMFGLYLSASIAWANTS